LAEHLGHLARDREEVDGRCGRGFDNRHVFVPLVDFRTLIFALLNIVYWIQLRLQSDGRSRMAPGQPITTCDRNYAMKSTLNVQILVLLATAVPCIGIDVAAQEAFEQEGASGVLEQIVVTARKR